MAEADPFVTLSGGRSFFRTEDLQRLAALLERLSAELGCKDDSAEHVKTNKSSVPD
jgi:hypothetical protein